MAQQATQAVPGLEDVRPLKLRLTPTQDPIERRKDVQHFFRRLKYFAEAGIANAETNAPSGYTDDKLVVVLGIVTALFADEQARLGMNLGLDSEKIAVVSKLVSLGIRP